MTSKESRAGLISSTAVWLHVTSSEPSIRTRNSSCDSSEDLEDVDKSEKVSEIARQSQNLFMDKVQKPLYRSRTPSRMLLYLHMP